MTFTSLSNALNAIATGHINDLVFDLPWMGLSVLLWAMVVVRQWSHMSRRSHLGFPRVDIMKRIPKGRNIALFHTARVLWWIGGLLMVFGLTRPRLLAPPAPNETEGVDIVVVLDVSGSMKAADFKPKDRLHVAKEIIKKHQRIKKSRFNNVCVFTGNNGRGL